MLLEAKADHQVLEWKQFESFVLLFQSFLLFPAILQKGGRITGWEGFHGDEEGRLR